MLHKVIFLTNSKPQHYILKIFLNFQPRYSYKVYSSKKERVYIFCDPINFNLLSGAFNIVFLNNTKVTTERVNQKEV